MIDENWGPTSKRYKANRVWFKNFDPLKRVNKFTNDPYDTNYGFNDCDIIVNQSHFMVIGKSKLLGKPKDLMPVIFSLNTSEVGLKYREVLVKNVIETGNDLEIEFRDQTYSNSITLVIRRIHPELKLKLQKLYQSKLTN